MTTETQIDNYLTALRLHLGPLTIAGLMANTLQACEARLHVRALPGHGVGVWGDGE